MIIIKKPVITEKMTAISEKLNRYAFIVDRRANKIQIKETIEELYGVKVTDVNTMIIKGKPKARYTKSGVIKGYTSDYKKAVVTLAEGEKIDFYSNI